jgi:hypothetical protein
MISNLQAQRTALDIQIAQEEHEEAKQVWEQAKARAREAKLARREKLATFKSSEAAWQAYELECEKVRQSLELHTLQRPRDDDFPTTAELEYWEVERVRLYGLLTVEMRARRLELASTMEIDRLAVLKADQELTRLADAERNARSKA